MRLLSLLCCSLSGLEQDHDEPLANALTETLKRDIDEDPAMKQRARNALEDIMSEIRGKYYTLIQSLQRLLLRTISLLFCAFFNFGVKFFLVGFLRRKRGGVRLSGVRRRPSSAARLTSRAGPSGAGGAVTDRNAGMHGRRPQTSQSGQWTSDTGHESSTYWSIADSLAYMHRTRENILQSSIRPQAGLDGLMSLAIESARSACGFLQVY